MAKNSKSSKSIVFGAVGDIEFGLQSADAMKAGGTSWPFEKMMPHFSKADVLFGNMESVVLPPDYPEELIDNSGLVSKFDGTAALKQAGFSFINLASNHILDGGTKGLFYTRDIIRKLGIAVGGVGRTQAEARRLSIIEKNGLRIGFLCYCEDTNYSLSTAGPCHAFYKPQSVLEDVARSRSKVDVLVVSIHADIEFMETPSVPRRKAFREIARAGADLVLGHHPHVPQGVETIGRSLVVYSLGNCYFRAHSNAYMKEHAPHTGHSFMLLANVSKKGVESFRRVPFVIPDPPDERPVPLKGSEKTKMLAYLRQLDRKAANDKIVSANWRQTALGLLDIYLERAAKMDRSELLQDVLGRLILTDENRNWVQEIFQIVQENWRRQAANIDPHHRPHYVMRNERKRIFPQ